MGVINNFELSKPQDLEKRYRNSCSSSLSLCRRSSFSSSSDKSDWF